MAVNFPPNPENGDRFEDNNERIWEYNSSKQSWNVIIPEVYSKEQVDLSFYTKDQVDNQVIPDLIENIGGFTTVSIRDIYDVIGTDSSGNYPYGYINPSDPSYVNKYIVRYIFIRHCIIRYIK